MLASTVLYGLFGILSRTVQFTIPLFYQNWTRALVAAIIAYIFLKALRQQKPLRRRDLGWIIARTLAGNIAFLSFFVSIINIPMGTAYFIFYGGSTIGGYLLGYLLFKERITVIKGIALVLAMSGLSLIYSINITSFAPMYLLLGLIAGIGTAVWNIFSKKVSEYYSAIQLTFIDNLFSFILYAVLSVVLHEAWMMPNLSAPWIASISLGILFVATGQLVVYGFKHLDAQIGSLVMLAEILFAILFGFIFYQESVRLLTLIGGICIVSAIILPEINITNIRRRNLMKKPMI